VAWFKSYEWFKTITGGASASAFSMIFFVLFFSHLTNKRVFRAEIFTMTRDSNDLFIKTIWVLKTLFSVGYVRKTSKNKTHWKCSIAALSSIILNHSSLLNQTTWDPNFFETFSIIPLYLFIGENMCVNGFNRRRRSYSLKIVSIFARSSKTKFYVIITRTIILMLKDMRDKQIW